MSPTPQTSATLLELVGHKSLTMTHLICDTNVFRNIGVGDYRVGDVAAIGEHLCYSPVTVLELAGKMGVNSFLNRRAAARAILETKARQLPDPEEWLTTLFGHELSDQPFDYSQALVAMANATSMSQLLSGVPDYVAKVQRRVSLATAGTWRDTTEQRWLSDMLTVVRKQVPGFAEWETKPASRRGQKPRLTGQAKREFVAATKSEEWSIDFIVACQTRAFFKANMRKPVRSRVKYVEQLVGSIEKVKCYCGVYTQYVEDLLTSGLTPQANDSGDTELFLYSVDDHHIVVTSEKRWFQLARAGGVEHRVRRITSPNI